MMAGLARAAFAALALSVSLPCGAATADDLADFNVAVEDVAAHNRTAIGYLRTDSIELAELEMHRARTAWAALSERFGGHRPAAFADNPHWTDVIVDVPVRIVGGFLMLTMNRPDLARESLQAIRRELSELRRASGVEVLADCVLDHNAAVVPIAAWEDAPPKLDDAASAADVAAKAATLGAVLDRCDALAPPQVRGDAEFRRLIDGARNSVAFITQAIATRDDEMLHRVVGELRAFDNLLGFRYG